MEPLFRLLMTLRETLIAYLRDHATVTDRGLATVAWL